MLHDCADITIKNAYGLRMCMIFLVVDENIYNAQTILDAFLYPGLQGRRNTR